MVEAPLPPVVRPPEVMRTSLDVTPVSEPTTSVWSLAFSGIAAGPARVDGAGGNQRSRSDAEAHRFKDGIRSGYVEGLQDIRRERAIPDTDFVAARIGGVVRPLRTPQPAIRVGQAGQRVRGVESSTGGPERIVGGRRTIPGDARRPRARAGFDHHDDVEFNPERVGLV